MKPTLRATLLVLPFAVSTAFCPGGFAATYRVGPGRGLKDLQAVAERLAPGDVVEVDGNATYPGGVWFKNSGTSQGRITIRGIRVAGKRPTISGGSVGVELNGDYYVFEGFEVAGASKWGVYHHAHDVVIRDCVIHDARSQGLIGAMQDSGSLLLEYCEIYRTGRGDGGHQVYMDTDQTTHPGAVFRMQHCYVHDGTGGNNVKSRAERNEIYYNWIESPYYHSFELIGRDSRQPVAHMDSDIVGNVIVQSGRSSAARVGHDTRNRGSNGSYRFLNNTFVFPEARTAIQAFGRLHSIEAHNNVFYSVSGAEIQLIGEEDAKWSGGRALISGSGNWVSAGTKIPPQWKRTMTGANPGFVNSRGSDLRPAQGSPLVNAGVSKTVSPPGADFPRPLPLPLFLPPLRKLEPPGAAVKRPSDGKPDIGAFEK